MKNIKEKQLLVNFAKALGQDVDPSIVKEVESYTAIQKEVHKSIRESSLKDLSEAFRSIKLEKAPQEPTTEVIIETNYPLPPSLDDLMASLSEAKEEIQDVFDKASEIEETLPEEEKTELKESLVDLASKFISEAPKNSFQQPDPLVVSSDIDAIRGKIKFLEQWLSKVSTAGPGSGEVRFRYLDDIDRASIGNTDQILRWRPDPRGDSYGKFFFGQLSGDQGPIRSMLFNTNGYGANANVLPGLVAYNNTKDCLDIYQKDGSILQVGLENYIKVYNAGPNVIPNGTYVQFSGVVPGIEAPSVVPYVNDANAVPLYGVGLATVDISANTYGRVTVLGEVNNVDTTGNTVGEVWAEGDLLWTRPGNGGKLTKTRPRSPNVVTSVAAVLHKDSANGILLVRPTIWPRLYYGSFSDTTDQYAGNINVGQAITFNTTDIASGFYIGTPSSRIYARNAGVYNFQFSAQIVSTNASSKDVFVWFRKSGVDIPNSNTRKSIAGNNFYEVIAWNIVVEMNAGEYFEIIWATTDLTLRLDAPPAPPVGPAIPSVILTISEIAL